jgi:hypothetical protein
MSLLKPVAVELMVRLVASAIWLPSVRLFLRVAPGAEVRPGCRP